MADLPPRKDATERTTGEFMAGCLHRSGRIWLNRGNRARKRDRGKALAGKSTLNRLELTPRGAREDSRYKKIVADSGKIKALFVGVFLQLHAKPPKRIALDLVP